MTDNKDRAREIHKDILNSGHSTSFGCVSCDRIAAALDAVREEAQPHCRVGHEVIAENGLCNFHADQADERIEQAQAEGERAGLEKAATLCDQRATEIGPIVPFPYGVLIGVGSAIRAFQRGGRGE